MRSRHITRIAGSLLVIGGASVLIVATVGGVEQAPIGWPQWGGPNRDFKVSAGRLMTEWPPSGPKRLWTRSVGEGYSAFAYANDTLYTAVRRNQQEVVMALDAGSGEARWEFPSDTVLPARMNLDNGPGPHATPLVVGNLVITAGVLGTVRALDRNTGRLVWRQELWSELKGTFRDRPRQTARRR
jgi:outer membrane protein assembly factor BamB